MSEAIGEEPQKGGAGKTIKGLLIAVLVLVFLLGGVGFLVWGVLGMFQENDAPTETAAQKADAEIPVETAAKPEVETGETSPPKGALAHIKDLTEKVTDKASTKEVTEFADNMAPSQKPSEPQAQPVAVEAVEPTYLTPTDVSSAPPNPLPPGPPITPVVRNEPDPVIQQWIENIHVTGFSSRKIQIDGVTYPLNAVINEEHNLRWVGADSQLGLLKFEDSSGVRYEKDY